MRTLPATEARVEGYDPDKMNPALVNQTKVVALHEAEQAAFGGNAAREPAKLKLVVTNADPKAREVRKPVEKIVEFPPSWGWSTFATTDVVLDRVNACVDIRIEGCGEPFALDWVQFINRPKGR